MPNSIKSFKYVQNKTPLVSSVKDKHQNWSKFHELLPVAAIYKSHLCENLTEI